MPLPSAVDRHLRLATYVVIVGFGIKSAAGILDSMLLAAVLTIAVTPVYERLRRRGVGNGIAIAATTLTLLVVVAALIGFLGLSTTRLVQTLPSYEARVQGLWQGVGARLEGWGIDQSRIFSPETLNPGRLFSLAAGFLSTAGQVLSQTLLLLIIVAFILVEAGERGIRLDTAGLLGRISADVREYLVITALFGLGFALACYLLLLGLGVDLPLVWAVVAFIMTFVPNIGIILSVVPPSLLALFEFGWQRAVVVVGGYLVMNFVIDNLIKPRFLQSGVDVSPLVGLVSLIVWSFLLGPMGALLAIPMTLAVRRLLFAEEVPAPSPPPPLPPNLPPPPLVQEPPVSP